jgi:hypothetical protein
MHSLSISGLDASAVRPNRLLLLLLLFTALLFLGMPDALAHAVAEGDKGFIQESSGVMALPFIYMGAKHMITGYDHLLFLFGVIFFERRGALRHPVRCGPHSDAAARRVGGNQHQLLRDRRHHWLLGGVQGAG